jgi:hypothetical protein
MFGQRMWLTSFVVRSCGLVFSEQKLINPLVNLLIDRPDCENGPSCIFVCKWLGDHRKLLSPLPGTALSMEILPISNRTICNS